MDPNPVFAGLAPFVERFAVARGIDPRNTGQSKITWHARQVQDSLSQLDRLARDPNTTAATKDGMLAHAIGVQRSLAALADATLAAIRDVAAVHGLDLTKHLPADEVTTDGDRNQHRRNPDRKGVGGGVR